MDKTLDAIFAVSPGIRYVAVLRGGKLITRQRADIQGASTSESDRYEELLVNPTLLKLATQRGEIDCGGLSHLVVGYGNFQQLVMPIVGGHASICFELGHDPQKHVNQISLLFHQGGPTRTS